MAMRPPRHRRSRSWSKDRASHKLYDRRSLIKSLCAFVAGVMSMLFLWGGLRVLRVGGPQDDARHTGERDDAER